VDRSLPTEETWIEMSDDCAYWVIRRGPRAGTMITKIQWGQCVLMPSRGINAIPPKECLRGDDVGFPTALQ
jgi:hypothetical protein